MTNKCVSIVLVDGSSLSGLTKSQENNLTATVVDTTTAAYSSCMTMGCCSWGNNCGDIGAAAYYPAEDTLTS